MREITERVGLCLGDGRLNPEAVGWARRPLHRTGVPGWGRTKRWEYWCVMTPECLVAVTVSSLDFLAVNGVYFVEYGREAVAVDGVVPFAVGTRLPESLGDGPAVAAGRPRIEIADAGAVARIRVEGKVEVDLTVRRPEGHESLNVVVPWDERRFQFTSKQTALPATGTVRTGGREYTFGEDSWAVLDHGRGRWPRAVTWNWGAASGRTGGRVVGLQLGGKWTAGTGMTENAICVDGRLTVFPDELDWTYDLDDDRAGWTMRGPGIDLAFTPFHTRRAKAEAGVIANRTVQRFGHYSGTVRDESGAILPIDGLRGWAEEVRMRW